MSGPICRETLTLAENEVHVWHLFAERVDDARLLRSFEAVLAPEERVRQLRFARPRDRRQYFLARVLARTLLGHYLCVPGDTLRFNTSPYGKPTLSDPCDLHFNLTHSHGLIACAVRRGREVGIDVEDAARPLAFVDLAERYFAPPEASALRGCADSLQREAFFAYWTLKEAFVKAVGQGLSYPLDSFAFTLDGSRLVGFQPLADHVPADWCFQQLHWGTRHCGAVAAPGHTVEFQHFDWADYFLT